MRLTAHDRDEGLDAFRCEVIRARESARVVPIGELDLATVSMLDQALCEQLEAGLTCLVLDLSRLTFIDSSGIHLIVRYQQRLEADGRQFRLIPGQSQVQRVLKLTGLVERLPFSTNRGRRTAPARISDSRLAITARRRHKISPGTAP